MSRNNHTHAFGAAGWPFEAPDNTSAICCRHVLERSRPILRVTHDEDDGGWQFLCGEAHRSDDARVVCLGCMVSGDGSLAQLADLPVGWCADRDEVGGAWTRGWLDGS